MTNSSVEVARTASALPTKGTFDKRFESLLFSEHAKLDQLQLAYVRVNWLEEITTARRRRKWSRFWFRILRFVAVAGALALPALAGLSLGGSSSEIAYATFAVSLIVALSTGGLQVFRFGTEWGIDEEYANALESEGWAYFQVSGKYRDYEYPEKAYQVFFGALESLRRLRNEKQVAEIIAAAAATTTGSGSPSQNS